MSADRTHLVVHVTRDVQLTYDPNIRVGLPLTPYTPFQSVVPPAVVNPVPGPGISHPPALTPTRTGPQYPSGGPAPNFSAPRPRLPAPAPAVSSAASVGTNTMPAQTQDANTLTDRVIVTRLEDPDGKYHNILPIRPGLHCHLQIRTLCIFCLFADSGRFFLFPGY